jgi:hypothetical protein
MDHAAAQRHLATTERLIIESRRSIARQREIIATLKCAGRDHSQTASIARALLHQMERRLERHAADRDWFRNICAHT